MNIFKKPLFSFGFFSLKNLNTFKNNIIYVEASKVLQHVPKINVIVRLMK